MLQAFNNFYDYCSKEYLTQAIADNLQGFLHLITILDYSSPVVG